MDRGVDVRFPVEEKGFSVLHGKETGPGGPRNLCTTGTGIVSPRVKRQACESILLYVVPR